MSIDETEWGGRVTDREIEGMSDEAVQHFFVRATLLVVGMASLSMFLSTLSGVLALLGHDAWPCAAFGAMGLFCAYDAARLWRKYGWLVPVAVSRGQASVLALAAGAAGAVCASIAAALGGVVYGAPFIWPRPPPATATQTAAAGILDGARLSEAASQHSGLRVAVEHFVNARRMTTLPGTRPGQQRCRVGGKRVEQETQDSEIAQVVAKPEYRREACSGRPRPR